MKRCAVTRAVVAAFAAGTASAYAAASNMQEFANFQDLRGYAGTAAHVIVDGRESSEDGGGGEFFQNGTVGGNPGCSATDDDDGVVLVGTGSPRLCWYRQFWGPVHLAWYGVPDAASDTCSASKTTLESQACAADSVARTDTSAGRFKVLHSFCSKAGCADGGSPQVPLAQDAAGNLFGTTSSGGVDGRGTAFELINAGDGKYKFKMIYAFRLQSPNSGGLIVDTAENLYGFSQGGEFYKLSYGFGAHHDKWGETDLGFGIPGATGGLTYAGASSGSPWDGGSSLYGVTGNGGQNGRGSVFSLVPNGNQWNVTVLYDFCSQENCADGESPAGGLVLGPSGQLYGTTALGGTHSGGVAFEVAASDDQWTESTIYNFCSQKNCSDGAFPLGNLTADANGNLFGVAGGGGHCKRYPDGCGVLFQLSNTGGGWSETALYRFCSKDDCRDGDSPEAGLFLDGSDNLFGTTLYGGGNDIDGQGLGGGIVYEFSGGGLKVLHAFCSAANCADGERPASSIIENSAGAILGTAGGGGQFQAGDIYAARP